MDVSLKASEKLAMEGNRYPCRARNFSRNMYVGLILLIDESETLTGMLF